MKYTKVICDGEELNDYYVSESGDFVSAKGGYLKPLKVNFTEDKYNPYPKISLSINGRRKTKSVHRLVCESWKTPPIPKELQSVDWDSISEKDRNILLKFVSHAERYQVNHIDHDIMNFNINNLEWVSTKENQHKYQIHKSSRL